MESVSEILCNEGHFLIFDPALWSVAPHTFSLVQPCVNNYTVVYTHKQYSVYIQYKMGGVAYGVLGLQVPILANFLMMTFCFAFCESCLSMVQKGGGHGSRGGGGWRMEIGEQGLEEGRPGKMQQDTPINR